MTSPLNDDGTVPLKRRLQVTMRVVEGKDVILETCQDVDMTTRAWAGDDNGDMKFDSSDAPPLAPSDNIDRLGAALARKAVDRVPELAKSLVGSMMAREGQNSEAQSQSGLSRFIDNNRQKGSTTRMVEAAIGCDGYVIVANHAMRAHVTKRHPSLRPDRVLLVSELNRGVWPKESRPVFIDAACLCVLRQR